MKHAGVGVSAKAGEVTAGCQKQVWPRMWLWCIAVSSLCSKIAACGTCRVPALALHPCSWLCAVAGNAKVGLGLVLEPGSQFAQVLDCVK